MEQYLFNINALTSEEAEKCLSLMSPQRKAYVLSISNPKRKKEAVAGEWFAKKAVSLLLCVPLEELTLERTEKGKPYIKDRDIHISISHSSDFVAVAADSKPVGIDIEVIKPIDLKVAKRVCSDSDSLLLNSCADRLLTFYKIWTAKEAYFKMKGTGIVNIKDVSYKDINATHTLKDNLIITTVT